MGYGDLQFFDIIVFAAIALFLVFRLRKVLGKRIGFEKDKQGGFKNSNNFIKKTNKEKNIPELDSNFAELKKAYNALENFDHKNFLDGSKIAFETIISAFNKGDKNTLQDMLNEETYTAFEKAINKKQNDSDSQLFSLNVEKIESVLIDQGKITIRIKD